MKISLLTARAQSGSLQLSVSRNLNSVSNGQNENLICQENIQFLLRNASIEIFHRISSLTTDIECCLYFLEKMMLRKIWLCILKSGHDIIITLHIDWYSQWNRGQSVEYIFFSKVKQNTPSLKSVGATDKLLVKS